MSRSHWRRHAPRALLTATAALLAALATPRSAWAACGVQDPGGCVDGALYSFWIGLVGLGWSANRTLLVLAYQLDAFRWWLVEVAFSSAYQVLVEIVDPLIVPFATVAVIVGCLALLLLPLFGRTSLVNVRHALVWALVAPLLLTLSGPLVVQLEQVRSGIGTVLFTGVRAITPGAIFGVAGGDMAPSAPLYPASPCGSATLARRSGDGLRMDDLAAALLWADAEDIHCPDAGGPSADMPDRFFEAAPSGPGYATDADVSMLDPGNDRTQAVQNIQRGVVRTLLGLLPSALAVLDALLQLVFALCLVALWIGLPIGLLFVFFAQTAGGVTGLLRRFLGVLQVSWSSSVLLGIVAACLIAAAELRNAAAYTGFAIGGLILTGYLLTVAVDTLKGCVQTLNDAVAMTTGLSITQPVALAAHAGGATLAGGAALASAGAATAAAATAAWRQTGSGRYAAAAVAGRLRPVAQLGEVAAAMGVLQDDEVLAGLHAGQRSTRDSWRGTRLQMLADAARTDEAGLTIREQARERGVARELARAERPTVVQELGAIAARGRQAYDYVGSAQMADDLFHAGDRIPRTVQAGWSHAQREWQVFGDAVAERSGGAQDPVRRGLAAVQVLDDRLRPGERGKVLTLDTDRRLRYEDPPQALPEHALSEPARDVRISRLLMLGYAVQPQEDGTVSFWRPDSAGATGRSASRRAERNSTIDGKAGAPAADRAAVTAEERERLVRQGALTDRRQATQRRDVPRAPAVHQQQQPADVSPAARVIPPLASTDDGTPAARLQVVHAAIADQRHRLSTAEPRETASPILNDRHHPSSDPDYVRLKLELREQELITAALDDPALAKHVTAQLELTALEARVTELGRAAVLASTSAAELPPPADRVSWRARSSAQRRSRWIERQRQEAQQLVRRLAEQRRTEDASGVVVPQFSAAALRAIATARPREIDAAEVATPAEEPTS